MKASINELEQRLKYLENTVGMLNQELPRLRQDFEQLKAENLGQYSQVQSNIQSEITSQGQYTNIVQPQVQSQPLLQCAFLHPEEIARINKIGINKIIKIYIKQVQQLKLSSILVIVLC